MLEITLPVLEKKDIRKLTLEQLKDFLASHGEKGFRAKQVWDWLWRQSARTFSEMNNLSLATREMLDQHFAIKAVSIGTKQVSNDNTIKASFRLHDGNLVEGVLIPA